LARFFAQVRNLLDNGITTVVVVGGAAEALDARPHTNDLTLNRRLGFIRLALEHGADLIPVYSFGENDAYKQLVNNPPGSRIRQWQEWLMSKLAFSIPLVFGKYGFLPFRVPITTVVGKPIPVAKIAKPTLGQILDVQRRYIKALTDLYDRYQPQFEPDAKRIRIVDRLDADYFSRFERSLKRANKARVRKPIRLKSRKPKSKL
jgi:2-acylglycerol O-acyltransferase 2